MTRTIAIDLAEGQLPTPYEHVMTRPVKAAPHHINNEHTGSSTGSSQELQAYAALFLVRMLTLAVVMVFSNVVAAHLRIHDNLFGRCHCFTICHLLLLLLSAAGQGLPRITLV